MDKLYYKYYSNYTESPRKLSSVASQYYRQQDFRLGSDINTLTVQYREYEQKFNKKLILKKK